MTKSDKPVDRFLRWFCVTHIDGEGPVRWCFVTVPPSPWGHLDHSWKAGGNDLPRASVFLFLLLPPAPQMEDGTGHAIVVSAISNCNIVNLQWNGNIFIWYFRHSLLQKLSFDNSRSSQRRKFPQNANFPTDHNISLSVLCDLGDHDEVYHFHYSGITWATRCLKSPTTEQFFFQEHVQPNDK